MKSLKLIFVSMAVFLSLAAFSQNDTSKRDTSTHRRDTTSTRKDSSSHLLRDAGNASATLQSSSTTNQPVAPAPNFGRYYIPVLGSYQAAQASAENKTITITGDESNPGKVWVEGLTPVKFYALLKTVPGTYKIPAQKQDQNSIAEGTLIYDETNKQINICVGCGFQDQNPSAVASNTATTSTANTQGKQGNKAKNSKATLSFSGTKTGAGTAFNNQ